MNLLYPMWKGAQRFLITDESAVGHARRAAVRRATESGLPDALRDRLAIVTTELAENLARHADPGGEIFCHVLAGPSGAAGIEIIAVDRGPGMASVEPSSQAGHRRGAGSGLGLGLGAVKRLCDEYRIDSQLGRGTAVVARILASPSAPGDLEVGGVCAPHPHEDVCGDGWAVAPGDEGLTLLLSDGLGHGPGAAEATRVAADTLEAAGSRSPAAILGALREPLRPTRGAAVLVLRIDPSGRALTFAGMGNIWGFTLSAEGAVRHLSSPGGIAGHAQPSARETSLPLERRSLVVLCSDGIHQTWSAQIEPALFRQHPSLAAAMIYRDHGRKTDDASVVAVRIAK